MSNILRRALFHIFAGVSIAIGIFFLPKVVLLVALGFVTSTFLIFDLVRLVVPRVNIWFLWLFKPLLRGEEVSHVTGASYILLASLIALLVFQRDVAVLGLLFWALGDSTATIVGQYIGRLKLLGKSLEGSLACFISCLVVGFIFYYLGPNIHLHIMLVGVVGATIAEALPLPINDNLTMPLFAGAVMTLMQI